MRQGFIQITQLNRIYFQYDVTHVSFYVQVNVYVLLSVRSVYVRTMLTQHITLLRRVNLGTSILSPGGVRLASHVGIARRTLTNNDSPMRIQQPLKFRISDSQDGMNQRGQLIMNTLEVQLNLLSLCTRECRVVHLLLHKSSRISPALIQAGTITTKIAEGINNVGRADVIGVSFLALNMRGCRSPVFAC